MAGSKGGGRGDHGGDVRTGGGGGELSRRRRGKRPCVSCCRMTLTLFRCGPALLDKFVVDTYSRLDYIYIYFFAFFLELFLAFFIPFIILPFLLFSVPFIIGPSFVSPS